MKAVILALGLIFGASSMSAAHSPGELESEFGDREKYFQAIEREAPAFTLQDLDGKTVQLADLEGKVVVLYFIYASCKEECPLHTDQIARVQDMVNETPMKERVQFLTITTDPENDTPEIMRAHGEAHGLDEANWTFLTTTPEQPEDATRQLAEAFGHKFAPVGDNIQVHGVVTHVIGRQGEWRANFHGLRFERTNLLTYINALVNDHHGAEAPAEAGFWDKVRGFFTNGF